MKKIGCVQHDCAECKEHEVLSSTPYAWVWEVLPNSSFQKRKGEKSGVYLQNPLTHGIDIASKESIENYKWTLVFDHPAPAARATTKSTVFNTLTTLNTTAPGGLHWDEYAAQEIAKAMTLAPTPSARTDELALAAAGEIMTQFSKDGASLYGLNTTQLQARVQCIVQRAIEAGSQRQPLTDALITSIAYDCNALPEVVTDETLRVFARAIAAITLSS